MGEGLPLIRAAREQGLDVTCEVTPHHLYYDISDITDENRGWMQMNPPLRSVADRQAMLAALRDGTLDYLEPSAWTPQEALVKLCASTSPAAFTTQIETSLTDTSRPTYWDMVVLLYGWIW